MVKIEGNPLKIITGEHTCDPATIDPLMHLCLSFASCIAKWIRRYYITHGIIEPIYKVSISMGFDDVESINICIETDEANFDAGVIMLDSLVGECYISKITSITKVFTIKCDSNTHTILRDAIILTRR